MGVSSFTGALKSATTCGCGTLAGTMTQADTGVCSHNTGMNTVAAATAGRRTAVVITITYTVDSAVATITLTSVVSAANAITREDMTAAIQAVVNANPSWAASVTVPTVLSVSVTN